MPLYIVTGADAQTGEDVRTHIDARDKFAAERAAREQGVLVERVDFATLDYSRPSAPKKSPVAPILIAIVLIVLLGAICGTAAWWLWR